MTNDWILNQKADVMDREIVPTLATANAIQVVDAASYTLAGQAWKDLTALEKKVKAYWEEDVANALGVHRALVAKRDAMLKPLAERKRTLTLLMGAWDDQQKEIQRLAQAKAEAEARRIADEATALVAAELEKGGDKAGAAQVLADPVRPAPVVVARETPGGFGNAIRKHWKAEVVDLLALVKGVASGAVPSTAIEANMVFLNNQARAMKELMNYPGVKAVETR